jgi:hypothetical protein
MRTVLNIKISERKTFEDLAPQFEIEILDIERAKFNGLPANFFYFEVQFSNPACLFDIGRALEALTKH